MTEHGIVTEATAGTELAIPAAARPDKPNGNGAPAVEDKAPALTGAE